MRYAIIGNGVAGTSAAFRLRQRDPEAAITLISGESDYFFSRTALMYAYMDRMNLRDLEPFERKAYEAQRIERRRAWVRNLDAENHELHLSGGSGAAVLKYDKLLVATGSVPNRFDWPGLAGAREGVTHFVSLQDLEACERLTPTTKRAVVVGGGLIGVELVECLRHHGVDVEFLVREPSYWPVALAPEEGALVEEEVKHHGVGLRMQEEVAEVLSDPATGRVTGVKTSTGAKLDCQMLGICIGVRPAVDWLKAVKTPPAIGRGIHASPQFRTSLPDVWAAGDCAEITRANGNGTFIEQIWYSARRQGELAAQSMLGDAVFYDPPIFYNSARFFEVEYTTAGQAVNVPAGAEVFFHRVPGRRASIRIASHHGAVIGFNMLGARWNHSQFETWIRERRGVDHVMANLHRAQFDVEFGRLPLDSARAAYAQIQPAGAARR